MVNKRVTRQDEPKSSLHLSHLGRPNRLTGPGFSGQSDSTTHTNTLGTGVVLRSSSSWRAAGIHATIAPTRCRSARRRRTPRPRAGGAARGSSTGWPSARQRWRRPRGPTSTGGRAGSAAGRWASYPRASRPPASRASRSPPSSASP